MAAPPKMDRSRVTRWARRIPQSDGDKTSSVARTASGSEIADLFEYDIATAVKPELILDPQRQADGSLLVQYDVTLDPIG